MKITFKNKLLVLVFAALVPLTALAADGAAGRLDGKGASPEERKARMEECKANPEKCRAEREARREQMCKDNPARCKEIQERREKRMAECKANPEKCRADKKAHFEQRFKRADTDGDGRISRDEAEKHLPRLARHFDRVDANKDGFVTLEEVFALRKAFFEHRRGNRPGRGQPTAI
jgi:hypothetical protein